MCSGREASSARPSRLRRPFPGPVAIEAKSIHRQGVFNFTNGTPVPSLDRVDKKFVSFVVRQIGKQIEATIPKVSDKPIFLFVDLNLPTPVALRVVTQWKSEAENILNQVDPWCDSDGKFIGRKINMITVSNLGLSSMDHTARSSEFLHFFFTPDANECLYPEVSGLIPQLKEGFKNYGTYAELPRRTENPSG